MQVLNIAREDLPGLVAKQLDSLLSFDRHREMSVLEQGVGQALVRAERCFSRVGNKYYRRDDEVVFNPFHTGQYTIFLYYLSNSLWRDGGAAGLAERVYYLNRVMNSVDLYFEVALPEVFLVDHPIGSIMGRGRFSSYFCFAQGCTVGNNRGIYPSFGENVRMLADSCVLGDCRVGRDVVIAARAFIKDAVIPDGAVVFGTSPDLVIKRDLGAKLLRESGIWRTDEP